MILYRICKYKPRSVSEEDDIRTRSELYLALEGIFPAYTGPTVPLPSVWHCLLNSDCSQADLRVASAYYHFAAIVLWRPLLDLDVEIPYTERVTSAILLSHGVKILEELEECKRSFPIDFLRGSNATMFFFYVAGFLLVFLLDRYLDAARGPFLNICRFLDDTSRFWPACKAMLRGLLAVVQQLEVELPPEAKMIFSLCHNGDDQRQPSVTSEADIPVSWTLPQHTDFVDLLSEDGTDTGRAGVELGDLMSKWSTITIT